MVDPPTAFLPLVRLGAISEFLDEWSASGGGSGGGSLLFSWGEKSDVETSAVCMSCAQNDRILMYVSDL